MHWLLWGGNAVMQSRNKKKLYLARICWLPRSCLPLGHYYFALPFLYFWSTVVLAQLIWSFLVFRFFISLFKNISSRRQALTRYCTYITTKLPPYCIVGVQNLQNIRRLSTYIGTPRSNTRKMISITHSSKSANYKKTWHVKKRKKT